MLLERSPIRGQAFARDAEESSRLPALCIVLLAFAAGQSRQDEFIGQQSAVHQRRIYPTQSCKVVGLVSASLGKPPRSFRQSALNAGVPPVQVTRRGNSVLQRSKDHGKHDAEGLMKAADGIVQGSGMLGNGSGYPGMGKLQQGGAAGSQK